MARQVDWPQRHFFDVVSKLHSLPLPPSAQSLSSTQVSSAVWQNHAIEQFDTPLGEQYPPSPQSASVWQLLPVMQTFAPFDVLDRHWQGIPFAQSPSLEHWS